MIYEFNQAVSKLDEYKAEAQVLIPVLQAARAELGEEQANRLIMGALRAWCRERTKHVLTDIPGTPQEKWETMKKVIDAPRTREDDLEFEILKWEPEALEYDVSRCAYADLFRELGESELGVVLACDSDIYLTEEIGPDIEYRRTQSLMQGGSCCDIRWRIKINSSPE
jgi:hypothetical protein